MAENQRLDELCHINMGQSPDSESYNQDGDGIPFFQGNADFGTMYPVTRVWCNSPTKVVEPGTLLISVRAPIGALNFAKERSCIGRGLAGITPRSGVYLKYIYYCLKSKIKELNAKGTGSTFKAIAKNALGETSVRIASETEQQRIIQILDRVSSIIDARKQQLTELDALIKAQFVETFGDPSTNQKGWKTSRAEDYIDLLSGYPFDSSQYTKDGVRICGGLIIMPGKILWNDCKYWDQIKGYEKYLLKSGDIVIALDRPWIAEGFKIAIVDSAHLPALLIQRTARIRAKGINQTYLFYCFQHHGFEEHCNITGSLVPHISSKDIYSYTIMLPPLYLQERFATFVAQVDKSKAVVQAALDETQKLFDSLMQQYFG